MIPRTSTRPFKSAFTILEIMVAMAVLLILVVLVAQLTSSTSSTVDQSGKHIDADSQARMVLSRMSMDFTYMLKRSDIDYSIFKNAAGNNQIGNDLLAFYSEGMGYYSANPTAFAANRRSAVSLVAYASLQDPNGKKLVFKRLSKALGWEPDAGGAWQSVSYLTNTILSQWPNLFVSDANYTTVGDQIFRFEYSYLLKPNLTDPDHPKAAHLSVTPWDVNLQHTSVDGFKDVTAIVVAIAVLDTKSRGAVPDMAGLVSALPDAQDDVDIAVSWNDKIKSPSFAVTAGIPQIAASAVRVYERYFYLDGR
jgi:prepilin-type N-terminal cleavage/methylation domain-containing protein